MSKHIKIGPQHSSTSQLLRPLGVLVAGVGMLLLVVGIVNVVVAECGTELPHYFWCLVLGLPVLLVGLEMCQRSFLGTVARTVFTRAGRANKTPWGAARQKMPTP
jgi:hypothetical protein